MDLILWRHADAEEGMPDDKRKLTPRGLRQAAAVAQWLKPRLPKDAVVIASPARRAQQTAAALCDKFDTRAELGTGANYASILAAAGWPKSDSTVVAVGHQPTLGIVAAMLLAGVEQEWSMKKGAIWWISSRSRYGHPDAVLRAMISPDVL